MFVIVFLSIQLFTFGSNVDGANILACLTSASKSHHILETTILEELANRGHNLTVLSTFPKPTKSLPKNYHHIYIDVTDVGDWMDFRKSALHNGTKTEQIGMEMFFAALHLIMHRSEQVMTHEIVQNLMKSHQKFDLFFLGYNINDMMLGMAGHFRVPSVLFSTIPAIKPLRDMIGNPVGVSSTPLFRETGINVKYDFYDRFSQFIAFTVEYFLTIYVNHYYFDTFYKKHFQITDHSPTFNDVKENVSLIMMNTYIPECIRPALPNLIEVGGVHLKETSNPLPKNIQDIIDAARKNDDGIIVLSFGGNVRTSDMSPEKLDIFFNVLSKLKQKIIWKWESNEIPDNKPDNVYMMKWLPQMDLLAEPSVDLFISHCGTGGVYEAKFHGVPILGFPIQGDQIQNAKFIENQGWAIILNIDTLNKTILDESIHDLLTNSTYKSIAKRTSQIFRDRPMKPLDYAVYWIEYVIRYDGAKHLQSPTVHMNIIQKSSFDVIVILAIGVYIFIRLFAYLLKLIFKYRSLQFLCVGILAYYLIRFNVFTENA